MDNVFSLRLCELKKTAQDGGARGLMNRGSTLIN